MRKQGLSYAVISKELGIFHAKMMPVLQKAYASTEDSGQKERIRRMIENLEFTELTVQAYREARDVLQRRKTDMEASAHALKLLEQRSAMIQKVAKTNPDIRPERIKVGEQVYLLPFDPVKFRNMTVNSARKSRMVRRTGQPPVIDGKLEDPCWKECGEIPIELSYEDASKKANGATLKLTYDNDFLYVAVHCPEPSASAMRDGAVRHDSPVWNENNIDLFLDPENRQKSYYQIITNSLGTIFDQKVSGKKMDKAWTAGAEAKTTRGTDYWNLEMRIPLRNLTSRKNLAGAIWGFNLCRVRTTVSPFEYTCWNPTFGDFNAPERFGKIIFR